MILRPRIFTISIISFTLSLALFIEPVRAENLKKIYIGEGVLARVTESGIAGPFPEILFEASRRAGQEVEIVPIPWRRGQILAQEEPGAGAATVTRVPLRESLYVWVEEYMPLTLTFFVRKDSKLEPKSINDLAGVRVAIERGAVADFVVKGMEDHGMKIEPVSKPELIPVMMKKDRVDGWLIWDIVGMENFRQQDMLKDVRRTFDHIVGPIYLATNSSVSEASLQKWRIALSEMKTDGTIQNILESYYGDLVARKKK